MPKPLPKHPISGALAHWRRWPYGNTASVKRWEVDGNQPYTQVDVQITSRANGGRTLRDQPAIFRDEGDGHTLICRMGRPLPEHSNIERELLMNVKPCTSPSSTWATGALAMLMAAGLAMPAAAQVVHDPSPPEYKDSMDTLCNAPVEDLSCVANGKRFTYWLSLEAQIDGKKWYTAVATARNEPKLDGGDFVAPGEKLTLAQVTYVLEGGQWRHLAQQSDFGSIYPSGAAGNPPMEDESYPPYFEKKLVDGMILGVPTLSLAGGGVALRSYTMLRTAADKSGKWIYAGDIATGSDNTADCDLQDAPERCYNSHGTLTDTGRVSVAGWPEFNVTVTGWVPGENGKRRRATAKDMAHWRFDPAQARYVDPASR